MNSSNPEAVDTERLGRLKELATELGYVVRGTETKEVYGKLPEVSLILRQRIIEPQDSKANN